MTPNQDFRHLPRQPKAMFRHEEALFCIGRDYFGIPGDLTTPIFKDRSFEMMFRVSRSQVQRIFEDVMHAGHPFLHLKLMPLARKDHPWWKQKCSSCR
jgi:hypothetical protein